MEESVPRRLKPRCDGDVYGTSKDVPLTKRGFAQGPVEMTAFVGTSEEREEAGPSAALRMTI